MVTQAVRLLAVGFGRDDVPGSGERVGVVDLQGRVIDPVLVVQQRLEVATDPVAVAGGVDQDVR